ncbi:hypothetical protein V8C44DRAFT_327072 [Trichoderma aethiopicum]
MDIRLNVSRWGRRGSSKVVLPVFLPQSFWINLGRQTGIVTCKPLRTEAPVMQSRYKHRQIAMPQLGMASLFPYRYHTIIGLHPPGPHYPKWHQDNRTRSLMWQSNSILGHSTMCDNTGASCGRMEQDCEMVDDEVLVVCTACTRVSAQEPDGDSMANSAAEDASTANISESMVSGFETRESEIRRTGCDYQKGSVGSVGILV